VPDISLPPEQVELLESWYLNPDQFDRDIWPQDLPEGWQSEASGLIATRDRVAIRSGHGVGKTAWLARRIIWWGMTRHPWKVGVTAPSSSQMYDALWSELSKWHAKMPVGLRERFQWSSDYFRASEEPAQCFAVAKTARRETPDALAGLHSENMLYVIDEAPGVDDVIFETARGAMSTLGAKTIMTGNPTRMSGYFFDAFHKNREHWAGMKVSCYDSKRTNWKEIDQWRDEYGEGSNFFKVRALGEFPDAEDGVIIPLYLVEAAVKRDVAQVPSEEIWGLDVSGAGSDQCALAKRRGNIMPELIKVWRSDDLMVTVGKVMAEWTAAKDKPVQVCVDSNGIGAGVAHRLAEQGVPVQCINVSESHSSNDRFLRARDEMWERAQQWFYTKDCKIPDDAQFIGEITRIKWKFSSNGKMNVESKYNMKLAPPRGIGKSPDRSEAFCFTFMAGAGSIKKPQKIKYRQMGYA